MGIVVFFIVLFILFFAIFMIAAAAGRRRARAHGSQFRDYIAQHFPDVPAPAEMFLAVQQSQGKDFVALLVSEERREIIVLVDGGPEGIRHMAFPFSALRGLASSNRIISRGVAPKVYSYEQTMTLAFSDGTSVPFVLELTSNKHGSDRAPGLVADLFAPWEAKLNGIVRDSAGGRVNPVTAVTTGEPSAPTAAAWYPDPVGRHEMRYWDGHDWTADVADQGVQSTDPLRTAA